MKIALIAPVEEAVPPEKYGAIEWIVYYIADGLAKKGHEIDLYASGNSKKEGNYNLISITDQNIRALPKIHENLRTREAAKYIAMSKAAYLIRQKNYDVIHNHAGWRFLLFTRDLENNKMVTTHHSALRIDYQNMVLEEFKDQYHISLSLNQKKDLLDLNYVANIYNGIDLSGFSYVAADSKNYQNMFFLARISPEKGPVEAAQVARKINRKLIVAAKVDSIESEYFKTFNSLVDNQYVNFIGEVDFAKKKEYLSNSRLLLMPVTYEDPCPLVPLEAMACGTPVVAFAKGALPEQVADGQTGYLINFSESDIRGDFTVKKTGIDGLSEAVEKIYSMSDEQYLALRAECRKYAETRFSSGRMVDEYEKVYAEIVKRKSKV